MIPDFLDVHTGHLIRLGRIRKADAIGRLISNGIDPTFSERYVEEFLAVKKRAGLAKAIAIQKMMSKGLSTFDAESFLKSGLYDSTHIEFPSTYPMTSMQFSVDMNTHVATLTIYAGNYLTLQALYYLLTPPGKSLHPDKLSFHDYKTSFNKVSSRYNVQIYFCLTALDDAPTVPPDTEYSMLAALERIFVTLQFIRASDGGVLLLHHAKWEMISCIKKYCHAHSIDFSDGNFYLKNPPVPVKTLIKLTPSKFEIGLQRYVESGDKDAVLQLLRAAISPNVAPWGTPVIYLALPKPDTSEQRNPQEIIDVIKLLLEFGASMALDHETLLGKIIFDACCLEDNMDSRSYATSKDLIRIIMRIDAGMTFFHHVPTQLKKPGSIAELIADGKKEIVLGHQVPRSILFSTPKYSQYLTTEYLMADGIVVTVESLYLADIKHNTAIKNRLYKLFEENFPSRKKFGSAELKKYFNDVLGCHPQGILYIDLIKIHNEILGFNAAEIIPIGDRVIHHIKLAVAGKAVTQYVGLMRMVSFSRGFNLAAQELNKPVLTVYEAATLASYAQLLGFGFIFYPQYDCAGEWFPILKASIYAQEEDDITAGNYWSIEEESTNFRFRQPVKQSFFWTREKIATQRFAEISQEGRSLVILLPHIPENAVAFRKMEEQYVASASAVPARGAAKL